MAAEKNKKKSSFGPGFLVTAAFIGPGTVTTCSLAGAKFGQALLFAVVFATASTILLQEMTGRLSLGAKTDMAQALSEFPKSHITRFLFIILTLSSITFGCMAYEAGNIIGGALGLEMITSLPKKIWVVIITATAFFVLNRRRYKLVEKTLMFLVFLMSLSFLATVIIIRPNFISIVKGFIPSFPEGSLPLLLALIGTTIVPYNLFLHSSAVKEKWNQLSDLKYMRRDLIYSVCLGGLISTAIIITSASAYFEKDMLLENGIQMAEQLKPLFGYMTKILFGIGFFAAGMSSAITAPYAAAFASSGVLGWKEGQKGKNFRATWSTVLLIGLAVSLLDLKPLAVIVFAQMANGFTLPVASIFLLLILNNKEHLGILKNNIKQNILGVLVVSMVSALGIWNIIKFFF